MNQFLPASTGIYAAGAERWLKYALARHTDTSDTHPALRDRLAALAPEAAPADVPPVRESAANALLGGGGRTLLRHLRRLLRSARFNAVRKMQRSWTFSATAARQSE